MKAPDFLKNEKVNVVSGVWPQVYIVILMLIIMRHSFTPHKSSQAVSTIQCNI